MWCSKAVNRFGHMVGMFPNEEAMVRLIGVALLEQNDNGPSSAPVT